MSAEWIEQILSYFEYIVKALELFAIIWLLWGVLLSAKDFFLFTFEKVSVKEMRIEKNNAIKKMLGGYILLSLEILIAGGIIESIIKPTLQDIFQLAALVVIRTIISYFLNKEIGPVDVKTGE